MSGNAEIELFNDNPLIIGSRTEDVLGFYQLADEWGEVVYKPRLIKNHLFFRWKLRGGMEKLHY